MKNFPNNIKILSAAHKEVAKTIEISSLSCHLLIIRLNRKSTYVIDGERHESCKSDVTLMPAGSTYTVETKDRCHEYLAVRFLGDGVNHFELLHTDDLAEIRSVHSELCKALIFEDDKSRFRALSLFYRLLSLLSEGTGGASYVSPHKLSLIRPALDRIEEAIFSPSLKVGELHRLAGISSVYFRKIFLAHTGMLPNAYVTAKRLEKAREMLTEEGMYHSVSEIAEAVGYTDALYFSRIYKRRYGYSPRLTKKQISEKSE